MIEAGSDAAQNNPLNIFQTPIPFPFFFCGLKHCGKTTLGEKTAGLLGMHFYDSDDILLSFLNRSDSQSFTSVRSFYRTRGADDFMRAEAEAIRYHINNNDHSPAVYALGGGAADNEVLLEQLKNSEGTLFYILQEEHILLQRILKSGIPPFLNPDDPAGSFQQLYRKRDIRYRKLADYIIDIRGERSVSESVHIVLNYLNWLTGGGQRWK